MKLYHLVVPDDHGGMGHDQVGIAVDFENGTTIVGGWLIDPNTTNWSQMQDGAASCVAKRHISMAGAFPTLRGLADWTRYAVTEPDGTLVYQPEGVFRYARRDPELWQM